MLPKVFHPVLLYSADTTAVHAALLSSGYYDLAKKIAEKSKRSKTDRKYIDAIKLWDDATFDIDDEPVVSRGEEGAYVMVWQWVDENETRSRTASLV